MTGLFAGLTLVLLAQAWQVGAPCGTLAPRRGGAAAREAARSDSAFRASVARSLSWPGAGLEERILREYGAPIAAADTSVRRPAAVIWWDSASVAVMQQSLGLDSSLGADTVTLQAVALRALERAMARARRAGLRISPRGGRSASLRGFRDTEEFWSARVESGLLRLTQGRRLTAGQADVLRQLPLALQLDSVLALERGGMCFGGTGQKTILHSVAAPGSSQHLFGYAIDIAQHADARVRRLLAAAGYWQTVLEDEPHFTYLGTASQAELRRRGLIAVRRSGRTYWVPPQRPADPAG